jgi:hypothetical protein
MNPDLAASLTPKQRAFSNEIANGCTSSESYRRAYNTTAKDKSLAARASHLKAVPKVAAYIASLIARSEKKKALARDRKRELLNEAAEDAGSDWGKRIKAIEVDNQMTGDNAPQQVNVFGLGDLLAIVRKGK